jgi:hemoglobin-like flavoprotein
LTQVGPPAGGEVIATARASFQRCLATPTFLAEIYRHLFRRLPAAEPMFAQTDFTRQHRLLQHAIGLLLSYPAQAETTPQLLDRVAERHNRKHLDISPDKYGPFVESLLDSVRGHDPEFSPEVEAAWRTTLAPGVAFMQSKY